MSGTAGKWHYSQSLIHRRKNSVLRTGAIATLNPLPFELLRLRDLFQAEDTIEDRSDKNTEATIHHSEIHH